MPRFRFLIALLPFLVAADAPAPDPLAGLDESVTKAIADAQIPGLAIAVVKDDKVVYAKGFGVRKFGEADTVDENTVFAVGSTTKAFTAACIAMLVADGKMNWDDPVSKFLPGIELSDPYVTRELTVRDLLSHRAGLPDHGGDLLYFGYDYDRNEIIRRLRFLKGDSSFRSKYAYQNLMYTVAGELAGAASGRPWDQLVTERLFIPLGMDHTSTSVRSFVGMKNVATPHTLVEDKLTSIAHRPIDSAGGAGAINSTARDMAQWLRLLLAEGSLDGKRRWKVAQANEMFTPQTVIRLDGIRAKAYPEAHFVCYGLGWYLSDYRGRKLVGHGGNVDGMTAQVMLVPEEKLGIVVLANKDSAFSIRGIALGIVDRFLGKADKDRFAEMLAVEKETREEAKKKEAATLAKQIKDTKPSKPLEAFAGEYLSPLYGAAVVTFNDGKLRLELGAMAGELTHFHHDTFLIAWKNPADGKALVRFGLTDLGAVAGLRIAELGKPDQGDMAFPRHTK